ncbi:nitroreductase family deazaflavin-dependent oxidoreductase [Seongchinamella unica]|uniref:Nitroreductase family deazaflavin-dependent oxidoreductase n=1 Tax=Seongchinamella unica TaxID=2547392 RepID=A0A4R5LUV2_9GAMM|nr:nitroreductase family deazaflavin-dependent oxidoreductase [Seongchinamella unica]TDG15152.1 nitroreductase family deazaflavin-dependent oxidoreductase [Seongchinamella unica]
MVKYDYVKTRREDVTQYKENQLPAIKAVLRWVSRFQAGVFRLSKGRLMNTFLGGPVCMVTMTGAKSGKTRRLPLIHVPHGDNKLLVASSGGMPENPAWYYNIKAHPEIRIMADGHEKNYIARQISDEEKAALWPVLLAVYPDFDEYQARTDRNIPVFSCEPGN